MKIRMTESTFVTARDGAVYFKRVRADVPNRRVTVVAGRAGTRGRKTVRRFDNYASVRRYARRAVAGYEQVV